jgi:conserved hypothetical protein TIGR01033
MSGHSKWANIKHKKGKMDAIRGKITTKIAREITVAVRMGGADPTGNMRLKLALGKARENNVPKDNIQRAIQKGQGSLEGSNYEELTYEGYGPGGVALIVEVMTDNRNRTAADLRHLFSKNGGNMGESGCVSWMFNRKGLFTLEKEDSFDEDELMMTVLEAGADDMSVEDEEVEVLTSPEAFAAVQEKLEAEKVTILSAQLGLFPDTRIAVSGDDATKLMKLLDALEDHDDVQEVYGNYDLPEDEI